jgi:outer membrane immunogenic protein
MGMLRAVTIAILGMLGLAAAAMPAGADGPGRYPTYDATPGFYDFQWTGFFAGAHVGGAHTEVEATDTLFEVASPLIETYSQDGASLTGGVQAGWQKQWERFVVGAEVSYSALSLDNTTFSPVLANVVRSAEVRDLFTLTGRLGYADERWLAYFKGGWASAQVDVTLRDTLTSEVASAGERANGWTLGLGMDYALKHDLFLGVEYNYLYFRSDAPHELPGWDAHFSDAEVTVQSLVLRLNYRFGGPCCR